MDRPPSTGSRLDVPLDREPVSRSRADPAAFGELYDAYLPRIHRFILRRVRDRRAAEELTASTFERGLETVVRDGVRGVSGGGWLYRLAAGALDEHAGRDGNSLPPGDDGLAAFTAGIDRPTLRVALDALSGQQRQLIVLRFLDGLEAAEMAAIAGWSQAALTVHLHRALRTLQVTLDGIADADFVAISTELARAGAVVRARELAHGTTSPRHAFAADLRARLLAVCPSAEPGIAPAAPRLAGGVLDGSDGAMPALRPLDLSADGPLRRTSLILPAPRWTALAASALIALSVVGFGIDRLPAVPPVQAASASDAILIRDGLRERLRAGAALRPGDEIRVESDGAAVLDVGAGQARLLGGAGLRIDVVAVDRIVLAQLEGRVFHRVVVPPGQTYTVRTASVEWTASGTAFDIDLETVDGVEQAAVAALQHDVILSGPGLRTRLGEGQRAVTRLAGADVDVSIDEIDGRSLADPWLVSNARTDQALGNPLGVLGGLVLGSVDRESSRERRPPGLC